MTDATFEDVFDWLTSHTGRRAWIEIGCRDLRVEVPADFAVLRVLAILGEPYMVNDPERETGVLRVPFLVSGGSEMGGFEIQPACLSRARIRLGLLKVWQQNIFVVVAPVAV